jgi:hypothetical protein
MRAREKSQVNVVHRSPGGLSSRALNLSLELLLGLGALLILGNGAGSG